jgi:predicted dehydrogenase
LPTIEEILDSERLDVVIVAAPNRYHYPITTAALECGLHVLCEKRLGMSSTEARTSAEAADRAGVITLVVPFTYGYMPAIRYLKELVDDRYLWRPYHLNMRYFARCGGNGEYEWRSTSTSLAWTPSRAISAPIGPTSPARSSATSRL